MSFSSGQTKLPVTGCRYQVSVRRAGFHSSCNFRIDLPGENGSARRTRLFGIEIFGRVQVMVLTRRGGGTPYGTICQ